MNRDDRKAAITAYKERKADIGVYVVRCAGSGQVWVGSTPNLGTVWNRMSFTLRQGDDRRPTLQAAWREHGAGSFTFDVVERIDADDLVYGRDRTMLERVRHWSEALQAEAI